MLAYGRQSISWPMRIVALNQRNPASKAKFAKKNLFFVWQFYTLYKQKFSNPRSLLYITFPQGFWKSKKFGLLEVGAKRPVNGVRNTNTKKSYSVRQNSPIFFFLGGGRDFTPLALLVKVFKLETTSFHYFFPSIPNLKFFGHLTMGSGAKRTFNHPAKPGVL